METAVLPVHQRPIYPIPDLPPVVAGPPTPPVSRPPPGTVLCIDNGASTLRAGYSSSLHLHPGAGGGGKPPIVVENINAKYKDRKFNRQVLLAGGEVYVDATSRSNTRVPFEGDVVANFDVMENMLDYVLLKLGVGTETLETPVAMTETLGNPIMTELLFESYSTPSVAFSIDPLMALYSSSPAPGSADALVISSSTASTSVIPVLGGRGVLEGAKKLAWGGAQAAEYMLKLMQLKYPAFPGRLTSYQAGIIYRTHCSHSPSSYLPTLHSLSNPRAIVAADRIVQFPYASTGAEAVTQEEVERREQRKRDAAERLRDTARRQREEKLERQQEELITFGELRDAKANLPKAEYDRRLREAGFEDFKDLDEYLKKIQKSVTRARNKEMGIEEDSKEPPSFPLIEVPDHLLNETDLKEKRKQKLMKAGYDARIRMKAEKEEEKRRAEQERVEDESLRRRDFGRWLEGVRGEHQEVLHRIRARKERKAQLSDRKSLAAQNRMKSIAGLAADGTGGATGNQTSRKRKKAGAAEADDGFGTNDADWAVYREIDAGGDSEDEEDEQDSLRRIEARLLEYDPNFTEDDTAARVALRRTALLNAFVRGMAPDDPLDTYDPEGNPAHASQLHVNIERVRVPEVLWQPHMGGLDQAGLAEVVEGVLRGFNEDERRRLTSNIFITGSHTLLPGFDSRLVSSLRPNLPVGHPLNIVRSFEQDPSLDAWRGLAKWSASAEGRKAFVTRAEYEEYGSEWFKEHGWGNRAVW
ncbi:Actin-related protein 5 [Rhodosporidiobolus nylandii]